MAADPVTTLHFTLPLCSLSNCGFLSVKAKSQKSQHLTPKTCECFPAEYDQHKPFEMMQLMTDSSQFSLNNLEKKRKLKKSPEIIGF